MQGKQNRRENNHWVGITIGIVLCFSFFLGGSQSVAEEAGKPVKSQSFSYDATKIPDPFTPLIAPAEKQVRNKRVKKKRIPSTPLERFGIEQLKLVGITMGAKRDFAMIEDPEGKFYSVEKGMYIGSNGGQVVQILANIVVVEEEEEDTIGKIYKNRVVLKLFSESGGE